MHPHTLPLSPRSIPPRRLVLASGASLALWLAGCGTRGPSGAGGAASTSAEAHAYRPQAARVIYARYPNRIYAGKLPPLLYAVGTLQVDLDGSGRVLALRWLRAPRHAPEVIAEIERMVRASAPYPAPPRGQRITWTDTWLWDESGRFQLDTLTEGQLQG
jgi:protein TonB